MTGNDIFHSGIVQMVLFLMLPAFLVVWFIALGIETFAELFMPTFA